jgi:protein-tyrosine-phosphatase
VHLPRVVHARAARLARAWRHRMLARRIRRQHREIFGSGRRPGVLHPRLLFVGAADIGRSPFAQRAARAALAGCRVESAGFEANPGQPCLEVVVRRAREVGIDLSDHRSARLTRERVSAADIVLVMDLPGYERIGAEFPWALPRTTLLGLFATPPRPSIAELSAAGDDEARLVLDQIASGVAGLAAWIRSA